MHSWHNELSGSVLQMNVKVTEDLLEERHLASVIVACVQTGQLFHNSSTSQRLRLSTCLRTVYPSRS